MSEPGDLKYMRVALEEATLALAEGQFPVGCVLASEEGIVARGHRCNSGGEHGNELDHAEVVTLRRLLAELPGYDCSRLTLYCTMEPCLMCYATLLLSGVRRFIWAYEDVMGGGMGLRLGLLPSLYASMQVERQGGLLRVEALALFQKFFRSHSYWENSLLSRYTLAQEGGSLAK